MSRNYLPLCAADLYFPNTYPFNTFIFSRFGLSEDVLVDADFFVDLKQGVIVCVQTTSNILPNFWQLKFGGWSKKIQEGCVLSVSEQGVLGNACFELIQEKQAKLTVVQNRQVYGSGAFDNTLTVEIPLSEDDTSKIKVEWRFDNTRHDNAAQIHEESWRIQACFEPNKHPTIQVVANTKTEPEERSSVSLVFLRDILGMIPLEAYGNTNGEDKIIGISEGLEKIFDKFGTFQYEFDGLCRSIARYAKGLLSFQQSLIAYERYFAKKIMQHPQKKEFSLVSC